MKKYFFILILNSAQTIQSAIIKYTHKPYATTISTKVPQDINSNTTMGQRETLIKKTLKSLNDTVPFLFVLLADLVFKNPLGIISINKPSPSIPKTPENVRYLATIKTLQQIGFFLDKEETLQLADDVKCIMLNLLVNNNDEWLFKN